MAHVLEIERATQTLWDMCLNAVQYVIDNEMYEQFQIPSWMVPLIEKSWNEDHPSIYGRFDLAVKNGQIKMLEFNADTPTSLYETGIVQWYWLQDFAKENDQFNSVHEKLIAYWEYLKEYLYSHKLHFSCVKRSLEDLTTVEYMRDTAMQAGLDTKLVFIDDIGWNSDRNAFVDMEEEDIMNIFKLYPWEWLVNEDFGRNIPMDANRALWIEPPWRMILSNKAILPVLWNMFPNHPLLLKSYFEQGDLVDYVKKPILSREGSNIEIVKNGDVLQKTGGEYGDGPFVYQELFELPEFDGNRTLVGSWVIGQEPAGMGIREQESLITGNMARFVPHLIQD